MKYWIIADTHFGHYKMMDYCERPKNFEDIILKNLSKNINETDCLIHLGDVCIGEDSKWNSKLLVTASLLTGKTILVKGNHDSKSDSWYYQHGWDFVCETFTLNKYGYNILFSHIPQDGNFDINIHGHLHNVNRRKEVNIKLDKHILYAPEYENYRPITLKHIIERIQK